MFKWEEFVEVRNLWERGWSVSAIARHLRKDRKTIRRYLTEPNVQPGQHQPVAKLLDGFAEYLEARLQDNPHLAGTVLLKEVQRLGFRGSYPTLARYVAEARPDCPQCSESDPAEAAIMRHPPGSTQADWSPFWWTPTGQDQEIGLQLFGMELSRPRAIYAVFVERATWAHLAWGHMEAFDYFGAVPSQVRYDRATQLFRPGTTQPTAALADFVSYYGFKPLANPKGRPRTNGQIERVFLYIATSFFPTVEAATVGELNGKLRRWLDGEANLRTSEDIVVPPWEALEVERAHLLPVRRPPYPLKVTVGRKVPRRCLVRLDGGRYSVEPGHVGAKVKVATRPESDWIEIWRDEQLIGRHERVPAGGVSFDPAHEQAIEALTLASLDHPNGKHRRKRNDGRLGPRSAAIAAALTLEQAVGTDGTVQSVDLSRYDETWRDA